MGGCMPRSGAFTKQPPPKQNQPPLPIKKKPKKNNFQVRAAERRAGRAPGLPGPRRAGRGHQPAGEGGKGEDEEMSFCLCIGINVVIINYYHYF